MIDFYIESVSDSRNCLPWHVGQILASSLNTCQTKLQNLGDEVPKFFGWNMDVSVSISEKIYEY